MSDYFPSSPLPHWNPFTHLSFLCKVTWTCWTLFINLLDQGIFSSHLFFFSSPPPWNHSPSLKKNSLIRGKAKTLEDLNQKRRQGSPFPSSNRTSHSPPSHLIKIEICWRQIFEILTIYITFPGDMLSPTQIGPWSVQPFWRLLDTNKQTNKQSV